MIKRKRANQINFRLNDNEKNKLNVICENTKLNITELFINLINSEYEKLGVKDEKEK